MGIDPDVEPMLDEIRARLARLEEGGPAQEPVDLTAILSRLGALEAGASTALLPRIVAIESTMGALAEALRSVAAPESGEPLPVDPGEPVGQAPDLPTGYRRASDFRRARGDAANWAVDELIMTTWLGGAGTMGDPSLISWESDGAAHLKYRDGSPPRSGVLQLNRPAKGSGLWGAILEVVDPGAVCAFFTYAKNAREFDFELIKKDGQPVWAVGIHMPKAGGGTVSSEKVYVPLESGVHRYEVGFDAQAVTFWIDGKQVGKFTAADVPGASWEMEAPMQILCSVEHHGGWAGWEAADYAGGAAMRVHALMA
ncbi:glycoside hydrolase family 16 protein [Cereibacter sphaeroides]|jgi:hypothetical protein|uniref:glycoside hydrolase family 16 protein n=1 Tax=Cereibacter sphaeroides TaxID=1063 RepID=UPI0000F29E2D|nr:glycoside hydrolase, family 16 [Cereibacter sphaeroides ATCC 17029]